MSTPAPTEWLTVPEAARRAGVPPSAIRRLIDDGLLTCRQVPRSWPRVDAQELAVLIAATTDLASYRRLAP